LNLKIDLLIKDATGEWNSLKSVTVIFLVAIKATNTQLKSHHHEKVTS